MNMHQDILLGVLVGILTDPHRPPALKSLPPVMYPERQLQISEGPNGVFEVYFHHRYKHRRKAPLPDMEEIRLALNAVLPNGLYVISVKDAQTFITIIIRRYSV